MKEHWRTSKEKLVNLEEGLPDNGETSYVKPIVDTTNGCKQLIQCVKFLLYLELLLFVGWACYTIWQTYRIESMEDKIRDNIHEAELHNSPDQQLTTETSTISQDNLLAQMENLLHTENTLSKAAVSNFENRPENDDVNIVTKTTEDRNPEIKEGQKNGIKESSSLLDTDIPGLIKVEVESVELEENNSDSLQSQEDVLVWHFGSLPFPNIYNIKVPSQFVISDLKQGVKSESLETTEKPSEIDTNIENTESEQIDSDEATDLTDSVLLSLLLQDATDSVLDSDMVTEHQSSMSNDCFTMMCADNKPTNVASKSQMESESDEWKKESDVYDDIIINQSVRGNSDVLKKMEALIGSDEHIQDPTRTIESAFINSYLGESFVIKNWLLRKNADERYLSELLPFLLSSNTGISFTELNPLELTEADFSSTGPLNKRSNLDVMPIDQRLPKMSMENAEEIFDDSLIPEIVKGQVEIDDMSRLGQQDTEATINHEYLGTL